MLIKVILLLVGIVFVSADFELYFQWKQIRYAAVNSSESIDKEIICLFSQKVVEVAK